MKNKFLRIILAVLCLVCVCTAVACSEEPEQKADWYNPVETVDVLSFSDENYSIGRYTSITLNPNYTGNSKIEWTSSNQGVAIVSDDGVVLGISAGTTEITATVDGESATCTVSVSASNAYVSLVLSQNNVSLALGKEKSVYPIVQDNSGVNVGGKFATYAYQTENADVATVSSEGVIKATGVGQTTVIVTASYAGLTLQEEIAVKVSENVNLSFSKAKTELFANSLNGSKENSESLKVFVYENDQLIENPLIEYTVDSVGVAKVENGKLTALGAGKATVTATYQATGGTTFTANMQVVVVLPEINLNKTLELEVFDESNSTVDLNSYGNYFNGNFNSIAITDDVGTNIDATLSSGVVEIENKDLLHGNRELYFIINNQVKFTCTAKVVTKYISEPEELASFAVTYGKRDAQDNYTGWFVLENDIDMSGETVDCAFGKDGNAYQVSDDTIGFDGVFDGNGYTIFNIENSLFGRVSKNGVIKNLSIFTENLKESGTIAHLFAGRLENVNITVDLSKVGATHYSAIAYRTLGNAVISNVVLEILDMGSTALSAVLYDVNSYPPKVEKSYLISPSIDDPVNTGSIELGFIHYSADLANKDFSALDKSSGLWTLHQGVYRFTSSIYYRIEKIATPDKSTFKLTDGTLTWDAIEGADGYTVLINGKATDVATNSMPNVTGDVVIQIRAKGNGLTYRDGDYSDKFISVSPSAPYVADFDSQVYLELVSHYWTNVNFKCDTTVEYLDEYEGEYGVLKITGISSYDQNGPINFGFGIALPSAYKESGYTLRYRVEKGVDENGNERPGVRYISVDDGFRYNNDTSTWLPSNYSWQTTNADRYGEWITQYCTPSGDTTKDKLGFVVSTVGNVDGVFGGWVIYLSFAMDGDQVEYAKEQDLLKEINQVKDSLKGNELANFDSKTYEKLISKSAADFPESLTAEYLESYDGQTGVLKVTVVGNGRVTFALKLPKNYVSGGKVKVTYRIEDIKDENDNVRPHRVWFTVDTGSQYVNNQHDHELFTSSGGITEDRENTWLTEEWTLKGSGSDSIIIFHQTTSTTDITAGFAFYFASIEQVV